MTKIVDDEFDNTFDEFDESNFDDDINDIDDDMQRVYKANHNPKYYFHGPVNMLIKEELPKTKIGIVYIKEFLTSAPKKFVEIVTTMDDFIKDFEHALSSCMSYTGYTDIRDFIGKIKYHFMNPTTPGVNIGQWCKKADCWELLQRRFEKEEV